MYNYYDELEEIRREQKAMEEAIPPSEWRDCDDEYISELSKIMMKLMFGGDEN